MNKSCRFGYFNLGAKRRALAAGEVVMNATEQMSLFPSQNLASNFDEVEESKNRERMQFISRTTGSENHSLYKWCKIIKHLFLGENLETV